MSDKPEPAFTAGVETFLELYRIQPDIPFSRAFDELSMLQGCILHLTTEAEMEGICWPAVRRGFSAPWPRRWSMTWNSA
jgi:hypothetical protein